MVAFDDFSKIPRGHYGAIYTDPPWTFKTWSAKGTGRSAEQHYSVLSFDQLAAFPVAALAAPDCALLMWIVRSNMPEALRLIDAWGFSYKSKAFTWVKQTVSGKPHFGMGMWTRAGTEDCLLAVRGNPDNKSYDVYGSEDGVPLPEPQWPTDTFRELLERGFSDYCINEPDHPVELCASVHDALLIHAPLDQLEEDIAKTRAAMEEASAIVLDGFKLRTDVNRVRYPDRYMDEGRGRKMWDIVQNYLAVASTQKGRRYG
jgi:hypothetical protein